MRLDRIERDEEVVVDVITSPDDELLDTSMSAPQGIHLGDSQV